MSVLPGELGSKFFKEKEVRGFVSNLYSRVTRIIGSCAHFVVFSMDWSGATSHQAFTQNESLQCDAHAAGTSAITAIDVDQIRADI